MAAVKTAPHALSAEALFDDIGPRYETAFARLKPQRDAVNWLITQLESSKPAKCLDVGCGTGRPTCELLAAAGHDVLGIDISGVMISDARQKVPAANFEKASVKDFPSGPGSFDAVTVFFSMIADFPQDEIKKSLKEIYRWVKPGGYFIFGTVAVSANNLEMKWMGREATVSSLSAEEAMSTVKDVGFSIVHHEVSSFLPDGAGAGICKSDEVWEEPHVFIYARKG